MLAVALMYIGAVLLVNGVFLLGRADPKGTGVLNMLTGILSFVVMMIFAAWWGKVSLFPESPIVADQALSYANSTSVGYMVVTSVLLFSFTYLYLGACLLWGLDMRGLGWYALFVAITAVFQCYYFGFAGYLEDWRWGILWLVYASLWFLFFLVLALGRASLMRITAWWTVIVGVIFVWVPAYLMLINQWANWK